MASGGRRCVECGQLVQVRLQTARVPLGPGLNRSQWAAVLTMTVLLADGVRAAVAMPLYMLSFGAIFPWLWDLVRAVVAMAVGAAILMVWRRPGGRTWLGGSGAWLTWVVLGLYLAYFAIQLILVFVR